MHMQNSTNNTQMGTTQTTIGRNGGGGTAISAKTMASGNK
jgi:hypothetical protein